MDTKRVKLPTTLGGGRLKKQASGITVQEIPGIVKDLKAATYESREKTAHLMDLVAVQQTSNPAALVSSGAIKPLIDLVTDGNDGSQIHAASTLATIAAAKHEYQDLIVAGGAIAPLVQVARTGSNKAQTYAAAAIASLSEQHKHREGMVKAGAIVPLVRLVRGDVTDDTHVYAAEAIANVSAQNPPAQDAFFAAGVVPLLLTLLHEGKAQDSAAHALAKLLSPATPDAATNPAIQAEVAKDHGIPPLLALLSGMNVYAQVHSAEALANLARGNSETQAIIAKAGGIGPLLAMLTGKVTAAQAEGANALAQLTQRNPDNQSSVAKMGGIPLLVLLLTNNDPYVKEMAALAVTETCRENRANQTLAAEAGCVTSIVELLKDGKSGTEMDAVKAEAVGAIWVLSENHDDNKVAIAAKGGISPTVGLLAMGTAKAQTHASYALASLGLGNVKNQMQITTLLVSLLSTGSVQARANATASLTRLVEQNPSSQTDIATASPVPDLIGLLKNGIDGAKKFALWSLSLSITPETQKILLEEDAIVPLVASLHSPTPMQRQQAAAAISRLALKNNKASLAIAKQGGITPLINIVKGGGQLTPVPKEGEDAAAVESFVAASSGDDTAGGSRQSVDISPSVSLLDGIDALGAEADPVDEPTNVDPDLLDAMDARHAAAAALSDLATLPKVGAQIVAADGIRPLVKLVIEGDNLGKQHAAAGLARLATGCGEKVSAAIARAGAIAPLVDILQGGCGDDAQEEAAGALFALAEEVGNRVAITEAGGIGPLVTLLGSDNSMSRQHAKGVLVRLSIESANRASIIKKLVAMLSEDSPQAQEQAAAALANLASETSENRISIVDAGGIEPLLGLLKGNSSSKAKEHSMAAIAKLAYNSETIQSAIAEANGIPLLVNALASSSNAKEMMASAQLYSLAASALSQLAKGNEENQKLISHEGAISSLVSILGTPVPELQANTAQCLANLSEHNAELQALIARTGAIAPLCTLVREGADTVKEQAAAALWSLSRDNQQNKATVLKLGGIEPLVTLLVTGTSDNSLEQATGALSSMCAKNNDNRDQIAKLISSRLSSKDTFAKTPTGGVRLLSAVAKMCEGSPTNQAAIAKAGGVPSLIMWLSGNFAHDASAAKGANMAEAQAAAAHALLSMVTNNEPLQALIARSNGIQPLIELLSMDVAATQAAAARLLWHLSGNQESGAAIAAAGGIQPLCAMLSAETVNLQELAATVLSRLFKANVSIARTAAEAGCVLPLVKLLSTGSPAGQQQAVCALSEVALVPENREIIAEAAGGIEALVGLLTSTTLGTPETAARVLAHLACDGEGVQAGDDAAHTAGAARRQKIADAGGVRQLLTMLSAVSINATIVARKMWELVAKVIGSNDKGGDKEDAAASAPSSPTRDSSPGARDTSPSAGTKSKGQLDHEVIGVQEQAAATLCDLAYGDFAMQELIIGGSGVPPLLALLRSSSQCSQENAARAIWCLCQQPKNQRLIVDGGAIAELVALSKGGSARGQEFAAAVIAEIAKASVEAREDAAREADAAEGGAAEGGAAEGGADKSLKDQLGAIAAAGGIPCLVSLVSNGNQMGKERAASALCYLSSLHANCEMIARAGGLPPLVQLLDDENTEHAHEHAVAALARLAKAIPENQTQIAKKLVALLSLPSEGTQRRSAHVLWDLAGTSKGAPVRIVNAGAISPLVSLLGQEKNTSEVAREAAVGALSVLAENDPSNQLAIATGLVALLGLEPDEAKEHLDSLLKTFAEATDLRAAITTAGLAPAGEGGKVKLQKRQKTRKKSLTASSSARMAIPPAAGAAASFTGAPAAAALGANGDESSRPIELNTTGRNFVEATPPPSKRGAKKLTKAKTMPNLAAVPGSKASTPKSSKR